MLRAVIHLEEKKIYKYINIQKKRRARDWSAGVISLCLARVQADLGKETLTGEKPAQAVDCVYVCSSS